MSAYNSSNVKREEKGRNIQVVVRNRPFSALERSKNSYNVIECDPNRKEVLVKTGGMHDKAARKTYTFDMVFGPAAKQIDVYRSVVAPILDEVIMGYNCTVFVYGQTGTGKTFTMEGERTPNEEFTWEEDPLAGVIPRTLHQIFEKLSENGTEFSIKVSLLEIYNEELFDLLSNGEEMTERLQLFDDPRNKRGVVIKGLEEVTVHSKDEVYQILEKGAAKRRTASTLMNAYSSRSHSVFSVTIHMKEITLDGEELVKIGKLNLVDLAGSENIGRSGAVDKRAREAGNINQSLLTLGRVITALVEKRPHVPYRESKLTRILQDSLGGRTKTSIIATVSPSSLNLEETLSTLEYASRAKNIMNKPEVNQKLTKRTLIKEYTAEIERLKRDLAATREKNGVYLSAENYEHLTNQIVSSDELTSEYTERIAALEEERKTLMELFTNNKNKLDQCTLDLEEKQQRLEETNKDLERTQEKLTQEEFICSDLTTKQEELYSTASKLLDTAELSTRDVFGLHDKLDRKKEVEHHNSQIQMTFSERMDMAFHTMQHCVQQHNTKQHSTLDHFSRAMDDLLATNEAAFTKALSTVEASMGSVKQLMGEGVASYLSDIQQQKALSLKNKSSQMQLLEECKEDMEEVLLARVLPGLSALKDMLNTTLKNAVEAKQELINKMETLKEISVFHNGLAQDLATLRETCSEGLSSLVSKHDQLGHRLKQAEEKHQLGVSEVIQCLQNQLSLLAMETKNNLQGLHTTSQELKEPIQSLQQTINTGCRTAESQVLAKSQLLSATTSTLVSSLGEAAQETQGMLEESIGYCSHYHTLLSDFGERDFQRFSRTKDQLDTQAEEQVSLLEKSAVRAQTLQQNVECLCTEQLHRTRADLAEVQGEMAQAAGSVQSQASLDHTSVDEQQAELQGHLQSNLTEINKFLHEELRQDIPTGQTPQRRPFEYPRVLVKSRSRIELLEDLRTRQGELQAAMVGCCVVDEDEEEEEARVDVESLEEMSTNESEDTNSNELSYDDENLICNENDRVPFFKQKKSKKESKLSRFKVEENETASPHKSRLPLRVQN